MTKVKDSDILCFARKHNIPYDALIFKYKDKRAELQKMMSIVEQASDFRDEMFAMYAVPERFRKPVINDSGLDIEEAILLLDDNGYSVKNVRSMSLVEFSNAIWECKGVSSGVFDGAFEEVKDVVYTEDLFTASSFSSEDTDFLDEDDNVFMDIDDKATSTYEFEKDLEDAGYRGGGI